LASDFVRLIPEQAEWIARLLSGLALMRKNTYLLENKSEQKGNADVQKHQGAFQY
jgi:hypothetical protein